MDPSLTAPVIDHLTLRMALGNFQAPQLLNMLIVTRINHYPLSKMTLIKHPLALFKISQRLLLTFSLLCEQRRAEQLT